METAQYWFVLTERHLHTKGGFITLYQIFYSENEQHLRFLCLSSNIRTQWLIYFAFLSFHEKCFFKLLLSQKFCSEGWDDHATAIKNGFSEFEKRNVKEMFDNLLAVFGSVYYVSFYKMGTRRNSQKQSC